MSLSDRAGDILKESVALMPGGAPPMDPAMMGGAPPMDPAMMGGAPPMDPAMMGGGGMAPESEIVQGLLAGSQPEQAGTAGEGGQPVTKEDVKEIVQEALAAGGEEATGGGLSDRLTKIEQMLSAITDQLGLVAEAKPESENLDILSDEARKLKEMG